jgi:glutathione S-transferase
MIKLYWSPRSRSFSAIWLMEESGLPYERVLTDITTGAQKSPEYLAINPMGKVPAIVHGDTVVTEAAAIALYLADAYPDAELAPKIGDPARGTYLRWIVFNQAAVEPAITDFALKREPGPASTLSYGSYDETINTLAGALAKGPYILGERFSAADVVVGSGVRWMMMFKLLPERPEFKSYAERVTARPAFARALTKDAELTQSLAS